MKRHMLHLLLTLVLGGLVAGVAPAFQGNDEGGIGGTGIVPAQTGPDEGGIGGTGIIGVISDFGSIVVNGVHVDYDLGMALSDPAVSMPLTAADLKLGEVVAVLAVAEGARYRALEIERRTALVGTVTALDVRHNLLEVMGQPVLLADDTFIGDPELLPGTRVAVAGLWDGRVLYATRVQTARSQTDQLFGPVNVSEGNKLMVGDILVTGVTPGSMQLPMRTGEQILVLGQAVNGNLEAARFVLQRADRFGSGTREFLVEGYPIQGTDGLWLQGLQLEGEPVLPGRRHVASGRLSVRDRLQVRSSAQPASPTPGTEARRWPETKARMINQFERANDNSPVRRERNSGGGIGSRGGYSRDVGGSGGGRGARGGGRH